MSSQSKFLKLNANVLLEYTYDDSNILSENYQILSDLIQGTRTLASTTNNNNLYNTSYVVDPVLKKLAKFDLTQSFLKEEDYFTVPIQYDNIKLHLPISFSFGPNYAGFAVRIYTYDYANKIQYNLSRFTYDEQDTSLTGITQYEVPFFYNDQQWTKYIEFNIHSINIVANQRISTPTSDTVLPNSINQQLTKSNGLSLTAPIFIEFSLISSTQTVFGVKYYYIGDTYRTSITRVPEYQTLGVNIEESTQGDFFEISGTYGNANLDDFIAEATAKGQNIQIEYLVTLYEENILTGQQTFLVTENFSQPILYRPIITFSNTTAAIDVEMDVINVVDNSTISRFTSIGLTNNLFKYGKFLQQINISGAYTPKLYNSNVSGINTTSTANNVTNISITKVNYPILIDKYKILVSSSSSLSSDYKGNGLLQIMITPFDNVIKFVIAKDINSDGTPNPYNLSDVLFNASLTLSFKTDTIFLEYDIFKESPDNDFDNGVVIYNIPEEDQATLKTIYKDNKNFFLSVLSNNTNTRTLLYSGTFQLYNNVIFVQPSSSSSSNLNSNPLSSLSGLTAKPFISLNEQGVSNTTPSIRTSTNNENQALQLSSQAPIRSTTSSASSTNKNVLVFLKPVSEAIANQINRDFINNGYNIYVNYNYTFLILNVSKGQINDIQSNPNVSKVVPLNFNLGQDIYQANQHGSSLNQSSNSSNPSNSSTNTVTYSSLISIDLLQTYSQSTMRSIVNYCKTLTQFNLLSITQTDMPSFVTVGHSSVLMSSDPIKIVVKSNNTANITSFVNQLQKKYDGYTITNTTPVS
jgi:hypothetical protein